eukprot:CAMPEP_0202443712 /NCGR_PEP_ID=MMETSP1360-20130828/2899_1 /ASSEMBLY_ACC=CAM_ASM_000848 /TAXON_ID=515479 /ORGANISM="Licmophora paradoxa, Strain CCMP2313" /LENGTH=392 /DNA_ID=CAMNT_0049059461 /DNA_START=41 /DNA_END=1219 /DNA_ORIENTATION=-
MKISLILLSIFAAVSVSAKSFLANSKAGRNLLASSRKLNENEDGDEANKEVLAQFSIVYAGCHNTTSWTDEGIVNMGLIRYFLCPSGYCSSTYGCGTSSYGEYVVEMNLFLESYTQWKEEALRQRCEEIQNACGCDGDNDDCMYHCYYGNTDDFSYQANCVENEEEDNKDDEELYQCNRLEINDEEEDGGRRLEQEEPEYFMGPYCGPDAYNIYMTLFEDEECSEPIYGANSIYYNLAGTAMPYSLYSYYKYGVGHVTTTGILKHECISCMQPKEQNDDDDKEEEDELIELCEETYENSAKCESYGMGLYYTTQSGCNYIAQLKNYVTGYSSAFGVSTSTSGLSPFMVVGIVAGVAAIALAITMWLKNKRKDSSKSTPLMETEMISRTGVIA